MRQVILGVLFVFITISATAQSKIGTIDADYILSQMPENAEVNKGLETYNSELQTNLNDNIKEYETLIKEYQETSEDLEEEALKEKENKIIELENNIKSFRQKANVMMQMKRNDLTAPLYKKIDEAMQKVITEEGFTQIFLAGATGLAYSRAEDDITAKVLDKMGIEAKEPQPDPENTVEN